MLEKTLTDTVTLTQDVGFASMGCGISRRWVHSCLQVDPSQLTVVRAAHDCLSRPVRGNELPKVSAEMLMKTLHFLRHCVVLCTTSKKLRTDGVSFVKLNPTCKKM